MLKHCLKGTPSPFKQNTVILIFLFQIHKELHRFVNDSPQNKTNKCNMSSPRRMKFMRSESIGEDVVDYSCNVSPVSLLKILLK